MYANIKTIINSLGGKILLGPNEKEQIKSTDDVKILCAFGHEFNYTLTDIYVHGKWCPLCDSDNIKEISIVRRLIYVVTSYLINGNLSVSESNYVLSKPKQDGKRSVVFQSYGSREDNSQNIVVTHTDFLYGIKRVVDVIIEGLVNDHVQVIIDNLQKLKLEDSHEYSRIINAVWGNRKLQVQLMQQVHQTQQSQQTQQTNIVLQKQLQFQQEKEKYISELETNLQTMKKQYNEVLAKLEIDKTLDYLERLSKVETDIDVNNLELFYKCKSLINEIDAKMKKNNSDDNASQEAFNYIVDTKTENNNAEYNEITITNSYEDEFLNQLMSATIGTNEDNKT